MGEGTRWRRLAWGRSDKALLSENYRQTTSGKVVIDPRLLTIAVYKKVTIPGGSIQVIRVPDAVITTMELPEDYDYWVQHPYYPAQKIWYTRHYVDVVRGMYIPENAGECVPLEYITSPVIIERMGPDGYPVYDWNTRIGGISGAVSVTWEDYKKEDGSLYRRGSSRYSTALQYTFTRPEGGSWSVSSTRYTGLPSIVIENGWVLQNKGMDDTVEEVAFDDEDFPAGVDVPTAIAG